MDSLTQPMSQCPRLCRVILQESLVFQGKTNLQQKKVKDNYRYKDHKHSISSIQALPCLLLSHYPHIICLRITCVFLLLHETTNNNQIQDGAPQNIYGEIIDIHVLFLQKRLSWSHFLTNQYFQKSDRNQKTYFLPKSIENLVMLSVDAYICLAGSSLAVDVITSLLIMHFLHL